MKRGRLYLEFANQEVQDGKSPVAPSLSIELDSRLNLLAHAQCEEVFLGSQCGGHGKCGADRIRVLEGASHLSPVTAPERRLLSADDINNGVRLACQAFPDHEGFDIKIKALARNASRPQTPSDP